MPRAALVRVTQGTRGGELRGGARARKPTMMAEPRTTHNPMPPTETPTSVTETTRLVDNEDVEDPGCCVARICKRTMPCLRPRNDCPTCKEIGYDIKNDPLGVLCCVGWFAVCAASLAYLIYWIVMRAT